MAMNFSSIGFSLDGPEELEPLLQQVKEEFRAFPTHIGGAYLCYATPEGAELWAQFSPDKQLIGCHPHYRGATSFSVAVEALQEHSDAPLDGQIRGSLIEDEPGVPIVINVPDFRQHAARLTVPVEARLQIAAIAQELTVCASLEEFRNTPMGDLDSEGAMIPSGTFTPDGESIHPAAPLAIFSGRILRTARVTNSQSGSPFYTFQVKTLGGVIDVVADPEHVGQEPREGGVIAGSFFLSGRLLEPLPAAPVCS